MPFVVPVDPAGDALNSVSYRLSVSPQWLALVLFGWCVSATTVEAAPIPVYEVAEVVFVGPRQSATDAPARDVRLAATFRHANGAPEITVEGFFDGDGRGGIEGNVFKVRFCPVAAGEWTITGVTSNAPELAGQHLGETLTATESTLHGFWMPDDESAGRRWYRRSDGTHQYVIGNTHYTFLTEHGVSGQPTGSNIAADMAGNARYFKKVRFGLQSGQYPHPTEKPWLDDDGRPSDDGGYSHRPNPRWFHQRVDVAVRSALEHDLIADLILGGPDTAESRATLKAGHNSGDATPYLRFIAARYGSFPNVWMCLCNEYDIKRPSYTQAEIASHGAALRKHLPYATPLSVHDGSKIGWSAKFDALPEWADHQIIQKKLRAIAPAAEAIDFVWRGSEGQGPRRKPTINDELSYEGQGDRHSEADTIAAHVGALLGGGYGSTGEKYGQKLGQYFWGAFDPEKHSAADNLGWLRETIDREVTFWRLSPEDGSDVFPGLNERYRVLSWPGREYLLGTDVAGRDLVADLPPGEWRITRHDVVAKATAVLATEARGRFSFDAPDSRAVLFHFRSNASNPAPPESR
ncbi:MAG: DUF5060 domain-containing protein [Planctomycetaceae bacterium]|nr:DUF5060 domain-containing protein [Planctomycetaceae bacterium]